MHHPPLVEPSEMLLNSFQGSDQPGLHHASYKGELQQDNAIQAPSPVHCGVPGQGLAAEQTHAVVVRPEVDCSGLGGAQRQSANVRFGKDLGDHGRHFIVHLELNGKVHLLLHEPMRVLHRFVRIPAVVHHEQLDAAYLGLLEQALGDEIAEMMAGVGLGVTYAEFPVAQGKPEFLRVQVTHDIATLLQRVENTKCPGLVQPGRFGNIGQTQVALAPQRFQHIDGFSHALQGVNLSRLGARTDRRCYYAFHRQASPFHARGFIAAVALRVKKFLLAQLLLS